MDPGQLADISMGAIIVVLVHTGIGNEGEDVVAVVPVMEQLAAYIRRGVVVPGNIRGFMREMTPFQAHFATKIPGLRQHGQARQQ